MPDPKETDILGRDKLFEEKPGEGTPGSEGIPPETPSGKEGEPPADGEKSDKDGMIPKARLDEVIGERNELRKQNAQLTEQTGTILARIDELSMQGKSDREIAVIISEEGKEWLGTKGFAEAVESITGKKGATAEEIKSLKQNLEGAVAVMSQMIIERFKDKHPDFDEKNPEIIKRVKAGYTLEDAFNLTILSDPKAKEKIIAEHEANKKKELEDKAKANVALGSGLKENQIKGKPATSLHTAFKSACKAMGIPFEE